ncbi:MAG: hypothetical protein AB7O52_12625 [Planctomycetota bacterium]
MKRRFAPLADSPRQRLAPRPHSCCPRVFRTLALAAATVVSAVAHAQTSPGPDVVVSSLNAFLKNGTVGDITAYSMATTACNIGGMEAAWDAASNTHPVIAQNLYRLEAGRFEHIGLAWLKHAFCATNEPGCGTCQPTGCETMGVNCADTYGSTTNAAQGSLGPRSEVNPFTGLYPFPYGAAGMTGNAIYKRLQVHNSDLDPAAHPTALYFGEAIYITTDEQPWGTADNNASYRRVTVGAFDNGGYTLQFTGPMSQEAFAIMAWQDQDPDVELSFVNVPGDGFMILGFKASQLGPGSWHYEYALYNYNSHRGARSFLVPTPASATITNIGFHDVDYHSGETLSGVDWSASVTPSGVLWETEFFTVDPNANALRWGSLYNFRFDCDLAPATAVGSVGIFRPGLASVLTVPTVAPSVCMTPDFVRGDLNGDLAVNLVDVIQLLTHLFNGGPAPAPPQAGDSNDDGATNLVDAIYTLGYLFQMGPPPPFPFPTPGCL